MAVKLSLFLIVCLLQVTKADDDCMCPEMQRKETPNQYHKGQETLSTGISSDSYLKGVSQHRCSRICQRANHINHTTQTPGSFANLLWLEVVMASKINNESKIDIGWQVQSADIGPKGVNDDNLDDNSAQYYDKKLNGSNEPSNASQSANYFEVAYNHSKLANLSVELAGILNEKADLLMMMANDTKKLADINQLLADNYQKNATAHKNLCNSHEKLADALLALANHYQNETIYNQKMGNSSQERADPEIIQINQDIATIYWRKAEEDMQLVDLYQAKARHHKTKADHHCKLSEDYLEKAYFRWEIAKSELENASLYGSLANSTFEMANYRQEKANSYEKIALKYWRMFEDLG